MPDLDLGGAIDRAIGDTMAEDENVVLIGQDVLTLRAELVARHGLDRIMPAPISESALLGAATGAAMLGLRPIVELYMVDFLAVAFDAVLNQMAKLEAFSDGSWTAPVLIRAPSGAGYGDGGQHGQSLWGILAAIPGLTIVVPSTAPDAYGLTRTALRHAGPVILLEPKLLSTDWLAFLGRMGRRTVTFDVPSASRGHVEAGHVVRFGRATVRRSGGDVTIVSVAVGVHRALEAAERLERSGVSCEVIDLRTLRPLDAEAVRRSVGKTGRLIVVDEDYQAFGMTGELAAVALEAGLAPRYARVAVEETIPYARPLERDALPNVDRIERAARALVSEG